MRRGIWHTCLVLLSKELAPGFLLDHFFAVLVVANDGLSLR